MVVFIMVLAALFLAGFGSVYSRYLSRQLGENAALPTPAVRLNDGRDYVPTPTPVVFAHHFAAIAGAGPIVGPVVALVYGWVPALLWVVFGGLLIGAVHDYLALHMSIREDGVSVATIARRMLGAKVFLALTLFLIIMLALVCATFLNLSATALMSMLPFERLSMPADQSLFRVVRQGSVDNVVIGGIASSSVIVITAFAPLIGWMYIKRKISVWKCSLAAIGVCLVSVYAGLIHPVAFPQTLSLAGLTLKGQDVWKLLLSIYVLVAAGVPVWLFLQSRDFVNCHILYAGIAAMLVSLVVAGSHGGGPVDPIPAFITNVNGKQLDFIWPFMFITVACGAVSGFHSLCSSGTSCKQIRHERAARRIGYWAMLLETFLAVSVIAVMMTGTGWHNYLKDVYPKLADSSAAGESNYVLAFAVAMGGVAHRAWGVPIAYGALAGMVLLEGFLVTTLDAAVRLTRYLIEEAWRVIFGRYDVFAAPVGAKETPSPARSGEETAAGSDGIPYELPDQPAAPAQPEVTSGVFRSFLLTLRQYWVNSGLAVGLMLAFALTGGADKLWPIFATSNQLLAAMVLGIASLWLLRQGRKAWFAWIPGLFMFATTATSLVKLFFKYLTEWPKSMPLMTADIILIVVTAYLSVAGVRAGLAMLRRPVVRVEVEHVKVTVDE